MPSKYDPRTQTVMVPVTTMEEFAVLSAAEREALLKSLTDAEAEIISGGRKPYDRDELRERFLRAARAKRAGQ